MPTIINEAGFRIIIYPDDHLPPHVHVIKANEEVKIALGNEEVPPFLIESWMGKKNAKKALKLVMAYQEILINAWEEIHG